MKDHDHLLKEDLQLSDQLIQKQLSLHPQHLVQLICEVQLCYQLDHINQLPFGADEARWIQPA